MHSSNALGHRYSQSMDRLLVVSEELTLDESVYLVEPVSQALESIFIHRGNPPRRISSEAARWCALNRSAFHQDETSYDSDCDAAAVDDDDDMRGIVGDAMLARLPVKFKLLHNRRLVVKDKLLRPWSAGMMVKRIEEGSQGHYPLQRAESCADQASSSTAAVAAESQASLLPANKIDAGFFKSHAQRIKKQREMLRGSTEL
jgi:hypothetical protein